MNQSIATKFSPCRAAAVLVIALCGEGALAAGRSGSDQEPESKDSADRALSFTLDSLDDAPRDISIFGWAADPIDEPLVTDRPDFTESTEAIPIGRFQLESGYTFTYDREGGERTRQHGLPELLLRVGITRDFELRFGWGGYAFSENETQARSPAGRPISPEVHIQGAEDFELGFKLKIHEQNKYLPHLAILGGVTFPSGSPSISSGDVDPTLGMLWAYDLSDEVALAGQFLFSVPSDEGTRFFQSAASVSLGVSLTDRLGAYVEYFGFYPDAEQSDSAHTVNGGFTYLVDTNFQVDIRAGFGLNEQADDFFTGVGFAWRF